MVTIFLELIINLQDKNSRELEFKNLSLENYKHFKLTFKFAKIFIEIYKKDFEKYWVIHDLLNKFALNNYTSEEINNNISIYDIEKIILSNM